MQPDYFNIILAAIVTIAAFVAVGITPLLCTILLALHRIERLLAELATKD